MKISIVSKIANMFKSDNDLMLVTKVFLLILFTSLAGYVLGYQANLSDKNSAVVINAVEHNDQIINKKATKIAEINNSDIGYAQKQSELGANYPIVFGSVNGSKYYNYGCKSGDRIKAENRIYFATYAEAELQGYEPALNCKFEYGNN